MSERIPAVMSDDIFKDLRVASTEPFPDKVITVEPGNGRVVGLGVYHSTDPEPDFSLVFNPDMQEEMGVSFEHLDIPGEQKYMLMYQFHNFGNKPCEITLHRTEIGKPQ